MQSSEKKWAIQCLYKLNGTKWEEKQFNNGTCCVLIKDTQMLIVENRGSITTVVESVCLYGSRGKVEAKHLRDTIGISVVNNQVPAFTQFFKMRLAGSCEKDAAANCLDVLSELRKYLGVTETLSQIDKSQEIISTKPLTQVVKEILNSNPSLFKDSELVLPKEYIEETVRQCILDPHFPALVGEVGDILKKIEEND